MNGYHDSYYTQAVGGFGGTSHAPASPAAMVPTGSYYGRQPEVLRYPDASGSPQYSGYGGYGYGAYGDATSQDVVLPNEPPPAEPPAPPPAMPNTENLTRKAQIWGTVGTVLSLAGALTGAYHGYKRNHSAGWAFAWFLFGGMLPVFSIPLSLAQGYSKPKRGR